LVDAARALNALSALGLLLPAEIDIQAAEVTGTRPAPTFSALGNLLKNIRRHLGLGM
jgi:hypothetical protein